MDINNDLDNIITKSTLIYEKALKKLSISPVVSKITMTILEIQQWKTTFSQETTKTHFIKKLKKDNSKNGKLPTYSKFIYSS